MTSKMIRIRIDNCWKCPHVNWDRCSLDPAIKVIMEYKIKVPEWCPLPDWRD